MFHWPKKNIFWWESALAGFMTAACLFAVDFFWINTKNE